MLAGIKVGHGYFGKGTVISIVGESVSVNFEYPYGVRTVSLYEIQPLPEN
jgi:hypothetical protein